MFVQTADDLKADGKTLRLVNVGQQTLSSSDRPVRMAGHMPLPGAALRAFGRRRPRRFRARAPARRPPYTERTRRCSSRPISLPPGRTWTTAASKCSSTTAAASTTAALSVTWWTRPTGSDRPFVHTLEGTVCTGVSQASNSSSFSMTRVPHRRSNSSMQWNIRSGLRYRCDSTASFSSFSGGRSSSLRMSRMKTASDHIC